ncbi:MAG: hypothetical protein R3Y63_11380, partial [Eubacteriales bacterium]
SRREAPVAQTQGEAPLAQNPYAPQGQAPMAETPYAPQGQAPMAENSYAPQGQAPMAENPYAPQGQAPMAENPYAPQGQAPMAENPYAPQGQAPMAETQYSPQGQAPLSQNQSPEQVPVSPSLFQKQAPITENQPYGNLHEPQKNKVLPLVLGIVVAFVAVLGFGGYYLWNSPEIVVASAVKNTSTLFYDQGKTMMDNNPFYNFFKDVEEQPFRMTYEVDGLSCVLEMDYKNEMIKGSMGLAEDMDLIFYLSGDYTTIELGESAIGFTNATFARDLNNCSFADIVLDENYVFDPFAYHTSDYLAFSELCQEAFVAMLTEVEIEKRSGNKTMTIDGSSVKADIYEIYLPTAPLETALNQIVDGIISDPVLTTQMEQFFMLMEIEDPFSYGDFSEFYQEFEIELRASATELIQEYESSDKRLCLYIYKRQVVGLGDISGTNGVTFGSTENPWENILVYDENESLTLSLSSQNDVFALDVKENNNTLVSFSYDARGSYNNFTVYDGYESVSCTLDSSQPNKLTIQADGETILFEKNALSPDWFQQNQEFTPFLTMTELELGWMIITEFPSLMNLF